ncbi:MAG: hypothetical protein IPN75_15145 [Dechloromonas sp.]|uniref:Uncharacterized protein n=1 Tax=Candidatus Dechloromonas phosphorivorans TaxID=2899244 RepID=A0A9D7LR55_9RHOO|nr:hypothetical protein [Candidatus Dechloromonas phosphorivorans]
MATIDLDSIRMTSDAGQSLLANGAFSHKLDHWFFTVDNDPPWHIWSMPVAVLFDQGGLGVIASCLLVVLVLTRSGRRALGGDIASAGILPAMAGVLVIAMLDTLIDSPRILLLLLLLAWLGATRCRWRQART